MRDLTFKEVNEALKTYPYVYTTGTLYPKPADRNALTKDIIMRAVVDALQRLYGDRAEVKRGHDYRANKAYIYLADKTTCYGKLPIAEASVTMKKNGQSEYAPTYFLGSVKVMPYDHFGTPEKRFLSLTLPEVILSEQKISDEADKKQEKEDKAIGSVLREKIEAICPMETFEVALSVLADADNASFDHKKLFSEAFTEKGTEKKLARFFRGY